MADSTRPVAMTGSKLATCLDGGEIWDFLQTDAGVAWQTFEITYPVFGPAKKKVSVKTIAAPDIRPGSPLAAIKGGSHKPARLYYCDKGGVIREIAESNKKWSLNPDVLPRVLDGSGLAATCWDGLNHIRLFYQDPQGRIREHCCDNGKWSEGAVLTGPMEPVPLCALGMIARFGPGGPDHLVQGVFFKRGKDDLYAIEPGGSGWNEPARLMPGARDPAFRLGEAIAVAGDPAYHDAPLWALFYQMVANLRMDAPSGHIEPDDMTVHAYFRRRSGHSANPGQATLTPPKDLKNRAMTLVCRGTVYMLGWIQDDGWFNRR